MKTLPFFLFALLLLSFQFPQNAVDMDSAFEHVEILSSYGPRLAGSGTADDAVIGGIQSATEYIRDTLNSYGYDVVIEVFPFTTFQITEYTLIVDFDGDFSTPDTLDLTAKAIPPTVRYIDIHHDIVALLGFPEEGDDMEGKIPVFEYWMYYDPQYTDLVGHSDIALVYREGEPAFNCRFKEVFSLSYEDYLEIKQRKTPQTVVWVKFSSHSEEVTGYNIIGKKEADNSQRTVILTAHYDSVYSDGAIDNASGVAALLETARILSDSSCESSMYFAFFDAEEIGLLGSEAYVAAHKDELESAVCINVDSIASGDTVFVGVDFRYEKVWPEYFRTDEELDSFVAGIASDILGYVPEKMMLEDVGGYSDFVSFSQIGVPSTDISTIDAEALHIPSISEEKITEHGRPWISGGKTVYFQEDRLNKIIPFIHTAYDDCAHCNKVLFVDAVKIVAESAYQLSGQSLHNIQVSYMGIVLVIFVFCCWAGWKYLKSRSQ
jgi:hypothetical protein